MEKRVHKLTSYLPVIEKIAQLFREGYIVGGFVRDRLLRRAGGDRIDIDVALPRLDRKKIEELKREIGASLFSIKRQKEVFSLVKEGLRIDITEISGETIEEDLLKRDLTINSLAVDLREILSPFNDDVVIIDPSGGYEDLERGIIRPTSRTSFEEDPLRIVRGIRLKCALDFRYSPEFLELAKRSYPKLGEVKRERIKEELLKALSQNFYCFLKNAYELGVLFKLFPELRDFEKVPPGGLHQYSLIEHTLRSVRELEERVFRLPEFRDLNEKLLKLAALFHDVAKPKTMDFKGNKPTFYGHDKEGAPLAKEALERLGFKREWGRALFYIVKNHLRPFFLFNLEKEGKLTSRAIYRFFRDSKNYAKEILALSIADRAATSEELARNISEYISFVRKLLSFYEENLKDLKPLLTGEEIISIKGAERGGKWVERIKDKLLESQVCGRIKSKEEAVRFVKGFTVEEES